MVYFSNDYLDFFKELAANNHKDWFDANRKRYETVVRDPFKQFISELINVMAKNDPDLNLEPKDAIFRINRDIRFSKDKTPYKLNNSAIISKKGRKDKNYPGIYLEFGPERLAFYGGFYMPDSKLTQKIRTYFSSHAKEFKSLLSDPGFTSSFGEIQGEKSKRIPKEFHKAAISQPLLWNKQWYYYKHESPEIICGDHLMEVILELEAKSRPMKEFLIKSIS